MHVNQQRTICEQRNEKRIEKTIELVAQAAALHCQLREQKLGPPALCKCVKHCCHSWLRARLPARYGYMQ